MMERFEKCIRWSPVVVAVALFAVAWWLIRGHQIAQAELALAALFLSGVVLLFPRVRELSISPGGFTLKTLEEKIHRTRRDSLLGKAVRYSDKYFFLGTQGRYELPDMDTAEFLGAGVVLGEVEPEQIREFPQKTTLNSVLEAHFVGREDSGDLFFIFADAAKRKYKAHIGSMSILVDLQPDLKPSEAPPWTADQLQACQTLR